MGKLFRVLSGDRNFVDYGGKWYRKVAPGQYHILELTNMKEACGADADSTYCVDLSEIDLCYVSPKTLRSAVDCCGDKEDPEKLDELVKVEMLHSYGSSGQLGQWCGNAYKPLMQEAREMSRELNDPEAHEKAMNRTCNRLGSTVRETMVGDFNSAMVRGMRAGDVSAGIMAKMHGIPQETIEALKGTASEPIPPASMFRVTPGAVPSTDPLAYVFGALASISGQKLEGPREELAPAYIEGFRFGLDVKNGSVPTPDWLN